MPASALRRQWRSAAGCLGAGGPSHRVGARDLRALPCGPQGHDTLRQHCYKKHGGWAEARKRIFYIAEEAGHTPLLPWAKRNMAQSFQFFRKYSVPNSFNDWTAKAHDSTKVQPRQEKACAVCAAKDWLEDRAEVYLFRRATGTTTWKKEVFGNVGAGQGTEDADDGGKCVESGSKYSGRNALLIADDGKFCLGPREKVHNLLDVERYKQRWPKIPKEELDASSVERPHDSCMRWLLHTRRVACKDGSAIGDEDASVWCCRLCIENLCKENPQMPPLALANDMWLGRHHPLFREATLAERMLASRGRLLMRQLFLGRGAGDEVQKGMTGNTMLIAQPSPTYEQVLPNMDALNEGLVVLFCKSADDVSKAQMLVVNREQYRKLVEHRQKVCPVFGDEHVQIDDAAMDSLPDSAVPGAVVQNAQAMPEAKNIKTTLHGPGNRIPMCARPDPESDVDSQSESGASDNTAPAADGATDKKPSLPPEELNEEETVIGIDQESGPAPLKLYRACQETMGALKQEAGKLLQAEVRALSGQDVAAATAQAGAKEHVKHIAVDLSEIAERMRKSKGGSAELEKLAAVQRDNAEKEPHEALAVPGGAALSMFETASLPAAFAEFLFGDCVPFLNRTVPITCQQICDALCD